MSNHGKPARVYIASATVQDRQVTGKDDRTFRIRSQVGYLYGQSPMGLLETEINIGDDAPAYAVGVYEISGASFENKGFNRLALVFGGLRLIPCGKGDESAAHCQRMVDALLGAQKG